MKTALVVGRFQPFHKGHLYLLKKTLEKADKLIIAVGSSNVNDENNPLSYEKRVQMLETVISKEGLSGKVEKIFASPDHPNDMIWLKTLLREAGKFDMAVGNNTWTNDILKNAGYEVLNIPYLKRLFYQGKLVRKSYREGKNWKKRVPEYLIPEIEKGLGEA